MGYDTHKALLEAMELRSRLTMLKAQISGRLRRESDKVGLSAIIAEETALEAQIDWINQVIGALETEERTNRKPASIVSCSKPIGSHMDKNETIRTPGKVSKIA